MNDYFESIEELASSIQNWQDLRNNSGAGIDWQFKTADARVKLRKLYPVI